MSVTTLHRPTHRDALVQFEEADERGDLITAFGRCTVEYEGRASSNLGPGDRLLILKPDGSALVHTDEKRTPVNWQPPGCDHAASVRDGRLRVVSRRTSPDERLVVEFERVEQFSAYPVTDPSDLELHGTEEDLRRRILDAPDLLEAGFEPLATERQSDAGPMDIYGEDADGRPVVVELKRRRVGPSAVGQLRRYVGALEREFGVDGGAHDGDGDGDGGSAGGAEDADRSGEAAGAEPGAPAVRAVRGVLVAPSVTDRAAELLDEEGLEFVSLDPAE